MNREGLLLIEEIRKIPGLVRDRVPLSQKMMSALDIGQFNNLPGNRFLVRIVELTDETQVHFRAPDEDWPTYVPNLMGGGLRANKLNVYLTEGHKNRKRRSKPRLRTVKHGKLAQRGASGNMARRNRGSITTALDSLCQCNK